MTFPIDGKIKDMFQSPPTRLISMWLSPYHSYHRYSIILKNISQLGCLFPIYGKIKVMFQTTNQFLYSSYIPIPTAKCRGTSVANSAAWDSLHAGCRQSSCSAGRWPSSREPSVGKAAKTGWFWMFMDFDGFLMDFYGSWWIFSGCSWILMDS